MEVVHRVAVDRLLRVARSRHKCQKACTRPSRTALSRSWGKACNEGAARIAERADEHVGRDGHVGNPHRSLAEVQSLTARREGGLPPALPKLRPTRTCPLFGLTLLHEHFCSAEHSPTDGPTRESLAPKGLGRWSYVAWLMLWNQVHLSRELARVPIQSASDPRLFERSALWIPLMLGVVQAGERSGRLELALPAAARLQPALTYPALRLLAAGSAARVLPRDRFKSAGTNCVRAPPWLLETATATVSLLIRKGKNL